MLDVINLIRNVFTQFALLFSMNYWFIQWMAVAYQNTVHTSLLLESSLYAGLHPVSF